MLYWLELLNIEDNEIVAGAAKLHAFGGLVVAHWGPWERHDLQGWGYLTIEGRA